VAGDGGRRGGAAAGAGCRGGAARGVARLEWQSRGGLERWVRVERRSSRCRRARATDSGAAVLPVLLRWSRDDPSTSSGREMTKRRRMRCRRRAREWRGARSRLLDLDAAPGARRHRSRHDTSSIPHPQRAAATRNASASRKPRASSRTLLARLGALMGANASACPPRSGGGSERLGPFEISAVCKDHNDKSAEPRNYAEKYLLKIMRFLRVTAWQCSSSALAQMS